MDLTVAGMVIKVSTSATRGFYNIINAKFRLSMICEKFEELKTKLNKLLHAMFLMCINLYDRSQHFSDIHFLMH